MKGLEQSRHKTGCVFTQEVVGGEWVMAERDFRGFSGAPDHLVRREGGDGGPRIREGWMGTWKTDVNDLKVDVPLSFSLEEMLVFLPFCREVLEGCGRTGDLLASRKDSSSRPHYPRREEHAAPGTQ